MTRKHFEAIAHTLNANAAPLALVEDMADTLAETNPRFDRARFIEASTKRLLDLQTYEADRLAKIHGLVLAIERV